jgi:hypothetical protein
MATMSLAQWNALKQACAARKQPVPVVARICLEEAVRDKLTAEPDLLKIWSDDITNQAHVGYVAKLAAVAGGAPAPATP